MHTTCTCATVCMCMRWWGGGRAGAARAARRQEHSNDLLYEYAHDFLFSAHLKIHLPQPLSKGEKQNPLYSCAHTYHFSDDSLCIKHRRTTLSPRRLTVTGLSHALKESMWNAVMPSPKLRCAQSARLDQFCCLLSCHQESQSRLRSRAVHAEAQD